MCLLNQCVVAEYKLKTLCKVSASANRVLNPEEDFLHLLKAKTWHYESPLWTTPSFANGLAHEYHNLHVLDMAANSTLGPLYAS